MNHIQLQESLKQLGYDTVISVSLDGGEQVTIITPNGRKPKRLGIAIRQNGIFLLGFRDLYRMSSSSDIVSVISKLCDSIQNENFDLNPDTYLLHAYSAKKWQQDGTELIIQEEEASGWIRVSDTENERLWSAFISGFHFRLSTEPTDWPAINEPTHFVTWSVSQVRKLYSMDAPQFRAIEWRSREQLLQALIGLGSVVGRMYALDLNHTGYSFDPTVIVLRGVDKWPVPLIPIHNYSLFVAPTFSFGLFDHPWEESICVFGESLIGQLVRKPLPCFGQMIRSSARISS